MAGHDRWRTPPELFNVLDDEFLFELDAAASEENALCPRYLTQEMDALTVSWEDYTTWLNPPYTLIGPFVKYAYEQSQEHHSTVVVLLPTYTDTKYWKNYVCKAHEIRHLVGRLQFLDEDGGKKQSARFPSSVVIFKWLKGETFGKAPLQFSWDWRV